MPDLTDLTLIGFPDMHLIMNLNAQSQGPPAECDDGVCEGSEDCCNCREDCGDCVCGDGNCDEPCEDEANCNDDCGEPPCKKTVKIEIFTDLYPGETSWELVNKDTGEVVGSAGPHLVRGIGFQWEGVVIVASAAALLGVLLVVGTVRDGPYEVPPSRFRWSRTVDVARNRGTRLATFGYFGHMSVTLAETQYHPQMIEQAPESPKALRRFFCA